MARRLKYLLFPLLGMLMLGGCMKDRTYYHDSDYKKLSLSKLKDISSGGYYFYGSGTKPSVFLLWFCEDNKYMFRGDEIGSNGTYQVDLAHNQITFSGEETNAKGELLHGVMKVKGGYFEQEGTYIIEGNIQEGTNDLYQIRNSNCDPDYDVEHI